MTERMNQTFTVPGRLDGMNEYTRACRSHWAKGNQMKRDAQENVCWCIRKAHLKPHKGAVWVNYTFFEKPAKNGP